MRAFRRSIPDLGDALRKYFAYRVVYAWERPSIMRKHIYTGAMGNVYAFLISGLFFVYFGNAVGLTQFQWGLMGGLASFALTAQILSALYTQHSGKRKLIWFATAFADRGLRVGGILLAFWLWHSGRSGAPLVLIASICLCNFFGAMAAPPWYSWLADIIPEEEHGSFWGRRSAWCSLSVVLVMLPAGLLMDRIHEEAKPAMALVIFVAAGVIGLLDLVIHGTIPEPKMPRSEKRHSLAQMLLPLRDRGFRPWLAFNTFWTFAMTLGGALATLYFIEDLGIKNNFLGGIVVLTGCTLLSGVVVGQWAGRMVDRHGPKCMMRWGHAGWALLPVFWLLATPRTALMMLALGSVTGGATSTLAATGQNKLLTRFAPPEDCAMYVAVSSCLGSMAAGLGALTAGTVLKVLSGSAWSAGRFTLGGFHVVFVLSLLLRLAATFGLLPRVQDPAPREAQ